MDKKYDALLENLVDEGYITTPEYIEAFRQVRRDSFLPEGMELEASVNAPLPIGHDQTISQPLTVAFMLEMLSPQAGNTVLDIGSGSGWTTALLAQIVGPSGHVYAVELIPELYAFGQANVAKYQFKNVTMLCGDGTKGMLEHGPFDRIQVAAAAKKIPQVLLDQLKVGGKMIIPTQAEDLRLVERVSKKEYKTKIFPGFLFVPLIEKRELRSKK